ncbi:MAG: BtrH N-terminal domain-containing protein [Flavobacteriales bacterium]|nr:BtrH N-terminal domain-containing protein [Flavobacteriales bacterium]
MSKDVAILFDHQQSAHCESGVISNLSAVPWVESERPWPSVCGSGLFYSHMPFLKLNGIPVTSYRILPGLIFKRFSKNMGVQMKRMRFRDQDEAMAELDRVLDKGLPVGMLTSVFYLPYPPGVQVPLQCAQHCCLRTQGRRILGERSGDGWYHHDPSSCLGARPLREGHTDTNGRMYYPTAVLTKADLKAAAIKGLKRTARDMSNVPLPMFGVKGMPYLAKKLRQYETKLGERRAKLYLGNIIRMQEEIGTGGAGFRFMFAAFLQEAAGLLNKPELNEHAKEMTRIGDQWREFAFEAGRMQKDDLSPAAPMAPWPISWRRSAERRKSCSSDSPSFRCEPPHDANASGW